MWINEYDKEKVLSDFFEDGYRQGFERGFAEGFERGFKRGFERGLAKAKGLGVSQGGIDMLVKGISMGFLTTSQAAELAEMTEADFISAAGLC